MQAVRINALSDQILATRYRKLTQVRIDGVMSNQSSRGLAGAIRREAFRLTHERRETDVVEGNTVRVLLIDHDQQLRAAWQARFQTLGAEITVVTNQDDLDKAFKDTRFSIAVYRLDQPGQEASLPINTELLNQRCYWSVAIVNDHEPSLTKKAYDTGFMDCLCDDCTAEVLASRLDHASHLIQLDERLAQAQKLESVGELAAGIAHEINTPIQYVGDNARFVQEACNDINGVLVQCQKLIEAIDSGEDSKQATEALRSAMDEADIEYLAEEIPSAISQTLEGVDRVSGIVRAMKEFSHPGVSEMSLTDLSNSIQNTVMVARNEWKYVANLETDFDPDLPPVPCLPGEFNQVILNMIVNAAHAISDSLGATPEQKGVITISTKATNTHAKVQIRDTGQGVSPENIDRIFKPFFTTKAAGKGTGQGLAIAHSVIVEKHKGTIDVTSELGKGTCFTIQIPLQAAPENLDVLEPAEV